MLNKNSEKIGIQHAIFSWIEEITVCAVVVAVAVPFLFKVVSVSGKSMLPNYVQDDRLIISCLDFGYQQGDVVVVTEVLSEPIIKRIIATENQTVDIDELNGIVYVDGVAVDETLFGLSNGITGATYTSLEKTEFPAVVPEGHIFVLGDNRNVSEDSRYVEVGMVDERKIIGKAVLKIYPFDSFGFVK